MGILTLLRNAFGRSRKGRSAEEEPSRETSTSAQATATEPEASAAESSEPTTTGPEIPAQQSSDQAEEHDLVSAAFDQVTVPRQAAPNQNTAEAPGSGTPVTTEATTEGEPGTPVAAKPGTEASAEVTETAEPVAAQAPEPTAAAEPTADVTSEPETEPVAEAAPEPAPAVAAVEPEPAADVTAEPEPQPAADAAPDPETAPVAEPAAEAAPATEPEPATDSAPQPEQKPEPAAEAEPVSEPEPAAEATPEPEPQPEPIAETAPEPAAETPEPVSEAADEPETAPKPETETTSAPEPEAEKAPAPEPEAEAATAPEPDAETAAPEPAADVTPEPEATPVVDDSATADDSDSDSDSEAETAEPAQSPETTEAAEAPEAAAQATEPALPLARIESHAPGLATAYRAAAAALEKYELTGTRARVYLVLDRSASMRPYYKDGSTQALGEQALALAAHLDPEATVRVVFFSTELDGTGELTLAEHQNKVDDLHAGLGRMGRTSYHAAVESVLAHHGESSDPALVIFQTDGAPDAKTPATQSLTGAAESHPDVFFSFVAFGDPENKAFDYLRKLKTDNTAAFLAGETPRELTDAEVYEGLLASWRP
ncbi:VWA domain-containing protein [Streptomyces nodosus]|uniref:VWA domain-containing protein n=1 Tax=Streptomyces nodosus TaxID=40318 RepID=UPI003453AEF3